MKLIRISVILVLVPLIALGLSSFLLIRYVHTATGQCNVETSDAPIMHEAGFARLTIAVIGLTLLFIPFRRLEMWGWGGLAVILLAYILPTFVRPIGDRFDPLQTFHLAREGYPLARLKLENYFFSGFLLAGLLLSLPQFIKKNRSVVSRSSI